MAKVATRDTAPELELRRELHRRGLRYRVDAPIPGLRRRRADVLFTRERVAVFVDGCFWHGCPEHFVAPKANREWWLEKISTNRRRDADTDRHLRSIGWASHRSWEHEDPVRAADHIHALVLGRR